MNPIYLAAALAAFGWLLKTLVKSVLDGIRELKEAIKDNTGALTKFKDEAHETFLRKDDPRVRLLDNHYRRHGDETNPGGHLDLGA